MKKTISYIALFLFSYSLVMGQTTFCLNVTEVSNDGTNYIIKIEMQGNEAFKLGSSNLQFSFNNAGLSSPVLESSPLAPPYYQVPTVTEPLPGVASFNIELGFENYGVEMARTPDWTEIGQVKFNIDDASETAGLVWNYTGGTTGTVVYLDDEATQIFATSSDESCLIGLDAALPLELLSFWAKKQESVVQLEWQTASEINNKGFEVQKSSDARSWKTIEWVDGIGASSNINKYNTVDKKPFEGFNYYRLKQIDFDGDYEFSKINSVFFNSDDEKIGLYPNPAKQTVNIDCSQDITIDKVLFYDQLGRLCLTSIYTDKEIDISMLPEGIYLVEIVTYSNIFSKKLIKL